MTPEEQQRRSHLARLAQAARDELPRAAQSGLTTSLIAGAQPQNALADRRIYQPPLASMQAMNPEPEPGMMDALSDIYADPRRMLPGSGGWTEGVGAAAPHLAAAALDFVNPAAMAGRGVSAASVAKQLPPMKNAMMRLAREEDGHLRGTRPVSRPAPGEMARPVTNSVSAGSHLKWFERAVDAGHEGVAQNAVLDTERTMARLKSAGFNQATIDDHLKVLNYMRHKLNQGASNHPPAIHPHGRVDPKFKPTGRALSLLRQGLTPPR